MSLIALVAAAGPAAAAETIQGSGVGVGYSTINAAGQPGMGPLCLHANANERYVIDIAEGSVTAAETMPDSAAEYVGPLTVTIRLVEGFFFSPAGTFSDNQCTTLTAVAAEISVDSAPSGLPDPLGGSVNCPARRRPVSASQHHDHLS